jgi:hypothetical protein
VATADEIWKAVWTTDKIKGSWMTPDNPTWAAQSVLVGLYETSVKTLAAAGSAKVNAASAKTDSAAAKTGVAAVQTAVTALSATLAKTAADTAETRAAVARIEKSLATLQTSIATMVADAVKAALAASTVEVDVTVSGNVPGTTPAAVTLPQ